MKILTLIEESMSKAVMLYCQISWEMTLRSTHLEGVLKAQNGRGSEDADDRQNLAPRDAIIEV